MCGFFGSQQRWFWRILRMHSLNCSLLSEKCYEFRSWYFCSANNRCDYCLRKGVRIITLCCSTKVLLRFKIRIPACNSCRLAGIMSLYRSAANSLDRRYQEKESRIERQDSNKQRRFPKLARATTKSRAKGVYCWLGTNRSQPSNALCERGSWIFSLGRKNKTVLLVWVQMPFPAPSLEW